MGFSAFEDLYIESREAPKLKTDDVFDYLVARGVFRVGLDLNCPSCMLRSWHHIDDLKVMSACPYCGHQFNITNQLKSRGDWRYRRSGLFGREDNQLGSIPVALALQQLGVTLGDRLLMYSTALNLRSKQDVFRCEVDFLAVVTGAQGMGETPVQLLLGEAKTNGPIDRQDVENMRRLADSIPSEIGNVFIMFVKTGTFSPGETELIRSLNTEYENRVIIWSQDELEPYLVYERAESRLGGKVFATNLTDMARTTVRLWFSDKEDGGGAAISETT